MKTITIKYGGKVWNNVQVNQSGWISPGAPKDLVELLKNAPRTGYTSKNCPIVKSDDGTNIYLGAAELHRDDESIGGSSSGTHRTSSPSIQGATPEQVQMYNKVLKELLKLNPSKQLLSDFEALRPKTKEELIFRATLEAQGLTPEQVETVYRMQQENLSKKNEESEKKSA